MSYSLFTDNKKVNAFLVAIWSVIFLFGIISIFPPDWLLNLSERGKISEAYDLQLEGDRFLQSGDYNKAIGIYEYVLDIWPEMEGAVSNLGTAYLKAGEPEKAIETFNLLLEKNPERKYQIFTNLAEAYEKQGAAGKAIKFYLEAAESSPFPENLYQKLGELLMNRKKFDKAILAFEKSLNNKQDINNSYLGMLNRDIYSFNENETDYSAIKSQIDNFANINLSVYDEIIFNDLLTSDKSIAKTYNNIGFCKAMMNEFDESVLYFNKAIQQWPEFTDARNNLESVKQKLSVQ